jgi:hypothetical protein
MSRTGQKWQHSLWFALGVYLLGGIVLINLSSSAFFYFWSEPGRPAAGLYWIILFYAVVGLIHAATALWMVWAASSDTRQLWRCLSRGLAGLYLLLLVCAWLSMAYTYLTMPS